MRRLAHSHTSLPPSARLPRQHTCVLTWPREASRSLAVVRRCSLGCAASWWRYSAAGRRGSSCCTRSCANIAQQHHSVLVWARRPLNRCRQPHQHRRCRHHSRLLLHGQQHSLVARASATRWRRPSFLGTSSNGELTIGRPRLPHAVQRAKRIATVVTLGCTAQIRPRAARIISNAG